MPLDSLELGGLLPGEDLALLSEHPCAALF